MLSEWHVTVPGETSLGRASEAACRFMASGIGSACVGARYYLPGRREWFLLFGESYDSVF